MKKQNNTQNTSFIDSHIVMPKLLLKRFHNKHHHFCYYDVQKKYIGTKGSAKSTNVEYGYYSVEAECFLRDEVETPFGKILSWIDTIDFDENTFTAAPEFKATTLRFIHSLISRSPNMLQETNAKAVFFNMLPEQQQHDFSAIVGAELAKKNSLFEDYILTFMINKTSIPFVFPICGVYSYLFDNCDAINLPIAPDLALCLIHNKYALKLIHDNNTASMFLISPEHEKIVETMNEFAFTAQEKRGWGVVICSEKSELERLKGVYLT